MEKNCMNCSLRTITIEPATGREYSRCTLNDIRVNRRMHCEEWSDKVTITARPVYAVSVTSISTEKIRRH